MRPEALATAMGSGRAGPAIVCAQVGNVNTGALDPVGAIVDIAERHAAWVHVDGAFGLWAAAAPGRRHLLEGHERADSWATDAHKWLNVPYDAGLAFTRHPAAHRAALSISAAYLPVGGSGGNPSELVPELSRRARGFTVWAALVGLGRSGVAELVERCCALATLFAEELSDAPGVAILNDVVLNQALVRFGADRAPDDGDALTRDVVDRVQQDGTCWAGTTTWRGTVAMRLSVSNATTTEADVRKSAAAIRGCLSDATAQARAVH
jgi:glutamate/tyrosine decarboxylase-like PLP-dependent enzyme